MIKNWLDESDILFFEGLYNMNWSKVFENIKKDPEEWVEEGGWSFLQLEVINFVLKILF
jgi:nucleosome binding factor SPN SPT16 subunit